jgi:hypothetical protein
MPLRIIVSSVAFGVLVAVAGCGGGGETTTSTVTVTGEQAAGGSEDTAQLLDAVTSLREATGDQKLGNGATPQGFAARSCGAGVYVKAKTTSCAFALNVARDFFAAPGYDFYSYSPVTGKTYLVHCSRGYPILCVAGSARIVIT